MKLTVWGAARQVTGSMHLLETDNYKILIDCGLDYEKGTWLEENDFFPFNPAEIDVVVLTHAHIDHSGNLPTLLRHGFEGQILCTPPTADLAELLLLDSVNLFLNKERKHKGRKKSRNSGPKPLYFQKHVMDTMERMVTIGFNKTFRITGEITLEFVPAGHLLGAAMVVFSIYENFKEKRIAFTGDIGRFNYPVLVNPSALPQVDYLVCESTYGGRFHSQGKTAEEILTEMIEESCIKTPGRLIIPAFSIGRTQSLVFTLNKIFSSGKLPAVKTFVDSPLANLATDVYRKHHQYVNDESKAFYQTQGDEFEFEGLSYVQTLKESKEVSNYFEPCIIVSSAGMLEGGRIQDHLFYNIQNYYCTILFIGYSAKGTLGHRLLRGDPIVHIRDRDLAVYASIKQTDVLSGHGDHQDIMHLVMAQKKLKEVFLVHGEDNAIKALATDLEKMGVKAVSPIKGEVFHL